MASSFGPGSAHHDRSKSRIALSRSESAISGSLPSETVTFKHPSLPAGVPGTWHSIARARLRRGAAPLHRLSPVDGAQPGRVEGQEEPPRVEPLGPDRRAE